MAQVVGEFELVVEVVSRALVNGINPMHDFCGIIDIDKYYIIYSTKKTENNVVAVLLNNDIALKGK